MLVTNRAGGLILSNRSDVDQKTYFEGYGLADKPCKTCHVPYGSMYACKCSNVMCDACVRWSRSDVRVLNLNRNRRTRKKQRYVLETLKFNSYVCNKCKKMVGLRL